MFGPCGCLAAADGQREKRAIPCIEFQEPLCFLLDRVRLLTVRPTLSAEPLVLFSDAGNGATRLRRPVPMGRNSLIISAFGSFVTWRMPGPRQISSMNSRNVEESLSILSLSLGSRMI